ncbi:GntR family transcriptional regulator [Chelativorans sp. M5D2P16]|uniref:GntR family transcriptional regulator n=1 Tax=Chelativorans sp. M5D2P16 TaxID=3095678 RepID=UPI002ACA8165|nr:GntR family transcriptional regulator [Chelativorans sp. M5D2P16]MDZ5699351.1 GntR family transcriptional regulator [Chelativorans sp. M5D2P16]
MVVNFNGHSGQQAAEKAYRTLERMLVTLELAPGSVTTEGQLIDRLGMGRTPVREAIQRLAWEGLMEVRPRAGIAVRPLNASDWLKVIEARRGIEVAMARAAARFITGDTAARFRDAAVQIQKAVVAGNIVAFLEADKNVDETMAAAADNPFAASMAAPLQTHCRRFWYRYQADSGLAYAAEQHVRVIRAVLDEDEKAAMREAEALMRLLRKHAEAASRL